MPETHRNPTHVKQGNQWNSLQGGSKNGAPNGTLLAAPGNWSEFTRSTTFHGVRYVFDDRDVPAKSLRR